MIESYHIIQKHDTLNYIKFSVSDSYNAMSREHNPTIRRTLCHAVTCADGVSFLCTRADSLFEIASLPRGHPPQDEAT